MMKILVALSLLLVCEAEPSRRLDDADCSDDPEWYHKNRGPDYDCAWVALKTDSRCSVTQGPLRLPLARRVRCLYS